MRPVEALDKARSLAPVLRERAFATEQARRISDETIRELKEAGLFRILQPARFGGFELDPRVFLEAGMIISAACGSTGWVYSVIGVHNWQLGLMPEQAQVDVWGEDQDTLICSSYTPRGHVEIVDGGYRLSGRWSFSSGCEHAQWAILGGVATDAAGNIKRLCFLVPRTDYTIDDVWRVVGLRGTGSNDVVIEDAFVPEHRTHDYRSGSVTSDSPIYRLPFGPVFTFGIAAPLLGAAQGALDDHVAWTAERVRITKGTRVAEEPFSQARVAEAAGELDGASRSGATWTTCSPWPATRRTSRSRSEPARGWTRCAPPSSRSPRWTACSRTPAGGCCTSSTRSSGPGGTSTPERSTTAMSRSRC
jgi:3-hydroxy-9,10-secoandrosta-1,3,5(10)-triene-9,17-dione monooxygenase